MDKEKLRIIELFGGIGACTKALKRLGIPIEIVDCVEIDKYAVKSYNAINGTNFESQDITKWDKDLQDIDLIMHGSPCQDFSLAGKQAGGDEGSGTRSSLMYETIRIVEKIKPKYVVWENVKNVISKKHKHNFDNYINQMNELGYDSYYQVLNAKDYGIPQNRERVFTISIRKDLAQDFEFPPKEELKLKLKDMLEDEVDEKYYLSNKLTDTLKFNGKDKGIIGEVNTGTYETNRRVYGTDGVSFTLRSKQPDQKVLLSNKALRETLETNDVPDGVNIIDSYSSSREKQLEQGEKIVISNNESPTLTTRSDTLGICVKNNTKQGYLVANEGDGIDISSRMQYHRGTVQKDMVQTLDTQATKGVVEKVTDNLRIRKLTPKECWRLMGFDDEDIDKCIAIGISNAQLYKQAGNSIVVNVLERIFENLFDEEVNNMGDYEEDRAFFKNKCDRLEKRIYELVKINEIHQKENGVLRQELKELQTKYDNVERQYLVLTKR